MGKSRSPNRDKAFQLYKENNGNISAKEISIILDEKINNIYAWKNKDEWDYNFNRVGAPKGNKNALGNKGGAKIGNLNNLKHGHYCDPTKFLDKGFLQKFIPAATKEIIQGIVNEGVNTLDMLWDNIILCYSSIIRSQKIMYVKNNRDVVKELKMEKVAPGKWGDAEEKQYEVQFPWDRQERFLKAQASAMKTLDNMIKNYEDLLHRNWDLATEEQKARIEVLKAKINVNDKTDKSRSIQIVDDIDE